MPWKPMKVTDLRLEFVQLAVAGEVPVSRLCDRFGISRKTGYKWLERYRLEGRAGLADRPRVPARIARSTPERIEHAVIGLRRRRPSWGARKIRRRFERQGIAPLPAMSTITRILDRAGMIGRGGAPARGPFHRFEHEVPNALWQMDFKGWFRTLEAPCHPLTILDDFSRFDLCLAALPNERTAPVQDRLERVFRRYGLPDAILTDNGAPWGSDAAHVHTPLTVWLMLLGVRVVHIRPYHPQTQGKEERFHRTLNEEVISTRQWTSLAECQRAFDDWRVVYNHERPHDALGGGVPADRYLPSLRTFPERVREPEYPPGAVVRKVQEGGVVSFRGGEYRIPKAFRGYRVRLREAGEGGRFDVLFGPNTVTTIDVDKP